MSRYLLLLLILPVVAACNRPPADDDSYSTAGDVSGMASPSSNLEGEDCLVGRWEMDMASSYNMDAVNAMMANDGGADFQMEIAGTDGHIYLILDPDGGAEAVHDEAVLTIDADSPMGEMTTTISMNGSASGSYTVSGNEIVFEDGGEDNLTTTTEMMMGGRQISSSVSEENSVFESPEGTTTTFECGGDALKIHFDHTASEGERVFRDMHFARSGGPA